ncbi:hypothetical protein [Candidatus Doolittlea endobia]|uniref:hypothetical protein n=1 Tax=Candidatus Doolittlea endobia TaxID=1778262 RepID=UPI00131532C3|nr:hypothetical protein [Candidatus Doolittlea endobia]
MGCLNSIGVHSKTKPESRHRANSGESLKAVNVSVKIVCVLGIQPQLQSTKAFQRQQLGGAVLDRSGECVEQQLPILL